MSFSEGIQLLVLNTQLYNDKTKQIDIITQNKQLYLINEVLYGGAVSEDFIELKNKLTEISIIQ